MGSWARVVGVLSVLVCACGESEPDRITADELEQRGCELQMTGPFRGPVQAASTRSAAPLVDLRDASTEINVPTGGGMVRFDMTDGDSLDQLILVDRPVLVAALDQYDNVVTPMHAHTGLDQCPTLVTRFDVFVMSPGPYVLQVPSSASGTLNLAMYGIKGVPDFY